MQRATNTLTTKKKRLPIETHIKVHKVHKVRGALGIRNECIQDRVHSFILRGSPSIIVHVHVYAFLINIYIILIFFFISIRIPHLSTKSTK